MQATPDLPPELRSGLLGVAVFIILSLSGIIAWLLKDRLSSITKPSGPPREPLTGEKPTEYWEGILRDIEAEGNHALLAVLTEHHRTMMEMLGKIRARLRDSDNAALLRRFDQFEQQYKQDMVSMAKILRSIEVKFDR